MCIYINYYTLQRHNLQWEKVLGMGSLITVYFLIVPLRNSVAIQCYVSTVSFQITPWSIFCVRFLVL